ncbi:MAG: inorganic phosphate transporter [Chloroflexi bacterium]|jgi:PiT family inorganic phosphate transporter|nr:inorganic phosphate transporter [Chloroflexota bacterium]
MPDLSVEAIALVVIALAFGFFNGLHDSSNVVATVISTRAMAPRSALWMAALANGVGPLLFGVAVATTIGHEVVAENAITLPVVFAALLAAILWNVVTLLFGIPSSTSHALIGGIVGAAWAGFGIDSILTAGITKILLALFLSPVLGMIAGYVIIKWLYFLARGASPRINVWFQRGQLLTAVALALSHGTNDAQKTMGIIALGLVATGALSTFTIPLWVIMASAVAMGLGTLFGGWSLIRTLGGKFYRLRPIHGFTAQAASSAVILGAALLGGPVSTTHVVSSSIVGAGSADRVQMVRWGVVSSIVLSWFLTLPATAIVGALLYYAIDALF